MVQVLLNSAEGNHFSTDEKIRDRGINHLTKTLCMSPVITSIYSKGSNPPHYKEKDSRYNTHHGLEFGSKERIAYKSQKRNNKRKSAYQ